MNLVNDYTRTLVLQQIYDGLTPMKVSGGISYSIIETPDAINLHLVGTHDLEDAMRDVHALMVSCPFGRVHSGAWEGIQGLVSELTLRMDKPIVIDGHSLGAMHAGMVGCELFRRGYKNLEVVTFECPLWGDMYAMAYYGQIKNHTYQNYLNLFHNDVFTMVPVPLPMEPYAAVPNCRRYWSAPTEENEYNAFPENVQAHSLKDCVMPGVKKLCGL